MNICRKLKNQKESEQRKTFIKQRLFSLDISPGDHVMKGLSLKREEKHNASKKERKHGE
jgi:hypothetical protein